MLHVSRRKFIRGAAAASLILPCPALAFGLGRQGGRGGVGALGGIGKVVSGADTSWVLPGAAIDLDIQNNRFFGGTIANCFNGDQTQAIGALRAGLLDVSAGSLVISLNALAGAPTGASLWFTDEDTTNQLIYGQSNTVVRSNVNSGSIISATIGGAGTFTGGPVKIGLSWQVGVGRSLVANGGTLLTNAVNLISGETLVFINLAVLTNFRRATYWAPANKLSDGALTGITV
jgi:hypothetical protein